MSKDEVITRTLVNFIFVAIAFLVAFGLKLFGVAIQYDAIIAGALLGTFGYDLMYYLICYLAQKGKKETS